MGNAFRWSMAKIYYSKRREVITTPFESLLDIPATEIDGTLHDPLGKLLEGSKAILVVNVVSGWGMTKGSYTDLVQLYNEFKDKGFIILAFPSNSFENQEPGNEEAITAFCSSFNVQFPLFQKCLVNGPDAHPVFTYLRKNSALHNPATGETNEVQFSWSKFLLNKEGKVVSYLEPFQFPR